MKNRPKVSVVVPVYNVEEYLEKCLNSLVNQTLTDLEIIIVNDGSTDNSKKIIMNYKKMYPDKIIYLEKENGGLSDARNHGLDFVKGDYVAFLDSDDYIDLDAYKEMYDATDNGMKKIVECDFVFEFPNKSIINGGIECNSIEEYLTRGRVIACNKLFKYDWLVQQNIKFPKGLIYEDVAFFFSLIPMLDSFDEVAMVNKPFMHYVQRSNSISYASNSRVTDICEVYKIAINHLKNKGLFEKYKTEIEYKFAKQVLLRFTVTKVMKEPNHNIRYKMLAVMWDSVNSEFPNWKKNTYIKYTSISGLYLKLINKWIYVRL